MRAVWWLSDLGTVPLRSVVRRFTLPLAVPTVESACTVYEVRPREGNCGVNLISHALPIRRAVGYAAPDAVNNAIGIREIFLPATWCHEDSCADRKASRIQDLLKEI